MGRLIKLLRWLKEKPLRLVWFLPVFLFFLIECVIDPFPNSLWILRILNTQYLVHVRADLTIDGEPLVMARTFRCFDPVDYHWYSGTAPRGDVRASNGQSGDTLAGMTGKGRLFAINVPDACSAFVLRLRADKQAYTYLEPDSDKQTTISLNNDEIETPVVYEIHGERYPTQIDAYVAHNLLRRGYHGIQLDNLRIEKESGILLIDWNRYDWFGHPNWVRHDYNNTGRYFSIYAIAITQDRWEEVVSDIDYQGYPAGTRDQVFENITYLRSTQMARTFLPKDLAPDPFYEMLLRWNNVKDSRVGLRLRPNNPLASVSFKIPGWIDETIMPCVRDRESLHFKFLPDLMGVQIFIPYQQEDRRTSRRYILAGKNIEVENSFFHFLSTNPRVLYTVDMTEQILTKG